MTAENMTCVHVKVNIRYEIRYERKFGVERMSKISRSAKTTLLAKTDSNGLSLNF